MISKRAEKAAKAYIKRTPKEDLAIAQVSNGKNVHPGPYNLLPIMCTMDQSSNGVVVFLTCFLLRVQDDAHVGIMDWLLPFNERTEATVAKLIVALGWDNRIWPDEPGWPGVGTEATGLHALLSGAGLRATLTFPPDATGANVTFRHEILKVSTEFALCPEIETDVVPTEAQFAKLHELAKDPSLFKRKHILLKQSALARAVELKH